MKRSTLAGRASAPGQASGGQTDSGAVAEAPPVPTPARRTRTRVAGGKRQTAAERIGAASQELAGGIAEAASAAEELRRSLEQIAAAAEQAAGASHQSLASVTQLTTAFGQARDRAEGSRRRTETLQTLVVESAAQIDSAVGAVKVNTGRQLASVEVIGALESQAGAIAEITRAVAEMSDQTNLLALNAAIEAARAGEHGRGFAVVADEVRALAETAERRSREVGELAGGIGSEVRTLAQRVRSAAEQANSDLAAAELVTGDLEEIRRQMGELAEGSQSILLAAVEAEAGAREAQRGAESIASAAEEQSAAAAEAQRAVQQQATSLEESDRTAHALAELAETLQNAGAIRAEEVAAAAEQLSAAVQELSGAAAQILVAIDEISRSAQVQAAATQQSTTALTQIERSAERTRAVAEAALASVEQMEERLLSSRAAVRRMTDGVTTALTETRASVEGAARLEESGRLVEKLIDAIALIAVQTTMLAVSGSVEAARAGEAGRGFATVSGDIRRLASESGESADKVKDAVRAVQISIAAARRDLEQIAAAAEAEVQRSAMVDQRLSYVVTEMAAVRAAATEILQGAAAVLTAAREVLAGTEQIAAAAEEASGAATQSASAARQQAQGAEDLAAAIEEIAELAEALQAGEA